MSSRILVFSPYAWRPHLTLYEGTIARACQVRGASVEYLLCDGLLPECDNHWDSFPYNRPRPFDLCQRCQLGAKAILPDFDMRYRWLGEFVSESERKTVFAWAQSLPPSELRRACFDRYPAGDWVLSSVVSYFRRYPPDMDKWRVVNTYRGFLYSAAVVALGLNHYLDDNPTDAALLFNARQSITRVAFEIFKERKIRELTHEFPYYRRGHIMVKPNAKCWSIGPFVDFWRMWSAVPLSRTSLEATLSWLKQRRYGEELSWYAYNEPLLGAVSIRKTLRLSVHTVLLALFTSSSDESAGDPDLEGPYESQAEWVDDVIAWARTRDDIELVVRVHPNLAGSTGLLKAGDEFDLYDKMRAALPVNVRLIMPDDALDSYALMEEADVCLSFGSSVGLEMAMMGKPVVLASRGIYEDGSHVLNVRSKQDLPVMLERSLRPMAPREIMREAFRMAYRYVFAFELPFPAVSKIGVREVKLNYSDPEALAAGRDESLDHICRFLMDGHPVFDPPSAADRLRDTTEEDDFFDKVASAKALTRDPVYEKAILRLRRWNKLESSLQSAFRRAPSPLGNFLNRVLKFFHRRLVRRIKRGMTT